MPSIAATITLTLTLALCALMVSPQGVSAQSRDTAARARALSLFRESAELYREGRFTEAADRLREARRLHPEPVLSYNLARALEGSGDLEGAVEAYREYLEEAPNAPDAPAVRARLEGLDRHLAEVRALEEERARLAREGERERETEEPDPVVTPAPARSVDPGPWVVTGIGAAVVGTGAVLGALAVDRNDQAARADTHEATVAAVDEANTLAMTANVLLVAGGITMVAGTIWGIVDLTSGPPSSGATARLRIGPGSLAIDGTF